MTEIEERYSDLLFGVRRSVRYHRRRERFLDAIAKAVKVITAGAGAATVLSLVAEGPDWLIETAAGTTAVFSVLDIVFAFDRTARTHSSLASDFLGLEQDLLRADQGALALSELVDLEARRLTIESREPPHLRALNLMCHNELVKAMGKSTRHYVDIPWYQRGLAQLVDINTSWLEKRDRETA